MLERGPLPSPQPACRCVLPRVWRADKLESWGWQGLPRPSHSSRSRLWWSWEGRGPKEGGQVGGRGRAAPCPWNWRWETLPAFLPSSPPPQAIKRTFDKKTVDIFMLFNRELSLVNKELSKKSPFLPPHMCHYSGLAHWMRALRRRVDKPMSVRPSDGLVGGWGGVWVQPVAQGPAPEDPLDWLMGVGGGDVSQAESSCSLEEGEGAVVRLGILPLRAPSARPASPPPRSLLSESAGLSVAASI